MARGPIVAVGAAALAGAGFLLAAVPLGARNNALPAGNIVLNGGFEEGTGSADGHFIAGSLPRWHRTDPSSGFTAVRYGATGSFPGTSVRDDVGGGTNFAAGGPRDTQKIVQLDQTIDLSPYASDIDNGGVKARVTAYIGGYQSDTDTGQVDFELDGTPNNIGFSQVLALDTLGPVTAADRGGQTKLVRRTDTFAVDKGARTLKVTLVAKPSSGNYTNVFFDNISVELFTGSPPPTTGATSTGSTSTGRTTTQSTTSGTTTSGHPPPPPPPPRAGTKPALALGCSHQRLVATIRPAKKSKKVLYVSFSVNGKARATDRKAPFTYGFSTKGLKTPVRVTAVVHFARSKLTIRKQHARCN
jgi:hypothetical protein